jgi:hypothetical protein
METNKELREAWEFVEHTGTSIFLTGKAGTGKTTFLKTVKEKSSKRMIVVAPTGVAAINAGGVTIHSFFQLPPTPYIPGATIRDRYDFSKAKRRIIASLDMLVIDEISMVRADLLDAVDTVLRRYRDRTQPFGGVQLLMIGDLQQLTPVVTPQDDEVLSRYYDTPYFFGSKALRQINYVTIQLTHVYRQQDPTFINILNHVRDGNPTVDDMNRLNDRCNPAFIPKPEEGYIRLTTHNRLADSYNENELLKLPGKRYTFTATVKGDFPAANYPADQNLVLKQGAQVMFIKNDPSAKHEYYNGKIGHVVAINEKSITVKCPGDNNTINVEQDVWENTKYAINPEKKTIEPQVAGTFTQYPLRLAWAITIHKSQGLTFEHAIIDAGFSFASGQVYVALSRCKSLEGMVLASRIGVSSIFNDPRVTDYISHQQQMAEESIQELPALKDAYYKEQLLDMFNFNLLYGSEQMLNRTMIEFFRAFPKLCDYHRTVMENVKKKVMDVAYKWLNVIRQTPNEGLHDEAFLKRVQRSSDYFAAALKEQIPDLLDKTKMVNGKNKMGMEQLDERYKDFWLQYLSKEKMLDTMADAPFTVAAYLQNKQEALIDAMEIIDPAGVRPRRRSRSASANPYDDPRMVQDNGPRRTQKTRKTPAEKTQKEPKKTQKKGESAEQSLTMFNQGQTIEQIAKDRGLVASTIMGHLASAVKAGKLTADKVIPAEHVRAIRHALSQFEEHAPVDDILAKCPKDIKKDEVYFMLNSMR